MFDAGEEPNTPGSAKPYLLNLLPIRSHHASPKKMWVMTRPEGRAPGVFQLNRSGLGHLLKVHLRAVDRYALVHFLCKISSAAS